MAINKVVYGNTTLIDLTDSTLSDPSDLRSGVTAYDRSGVLLTGTGSGGGGDYILTYDPDCSVGLAEVGTAVTHDPNYTPSGDIQQTVETVTFMTDATFSGSIGTSFSNGTLTLSLSGLITPTTATKQVATSAPVFVGNGVHFVIEENNS